MKIKSFKRSTVPALLIAMCVGPQVFGGRVAAAQKAMPANARIVLLHHSTGECVWNGGVPAWFSAFNAANKTGYAVTERNFPKDSPYGWENYPYDYWNIWVRHAGPRPFKQEPTLEILADKFNVIVFKHCFPVSNIEADTGNADVASSEKRLENYKLQYAALKKKMRSFPRVRFVVWTAAAQVKNDTDEAAAQRARAFVDWVRTTWDEKGDNIFVWDFNQLETGGGLYLKPANASGDAHPNERFSRAVAPLLCQRIVDVIQGRGDSGSITGQGGAAKFRPAATPDKVAAPVKVAAPAKREPPVKVDTTGPGKWVFDDAETKAVEKIRWATAAQYAKDGDQNVIKFTFADAREEDWGEYGKHMVLMSRFPKKSFDVKPFRYLAFRVKADQEIKTVVVSLLTMPDPGGSPHQSHFGFSAYVQPTVGKWKWVALDLTKLELAAEGATAHEQAGKPTRPQSLTAFKFAVNKKYAKAVFLIDDIAFFRDLPKSLEATLQQP